MLVAASGLAREVAESARRAGWDVLGCVDDNPALRGTEVMAGLPVLGGLEAVAEYPNAAAAVVRRQGCGPPRHGRATSAHWGVDDERYAVLVDPSVMVPPSCTVGAAASCWLAPCSPPRVTVGRHVVCMPHVVLTHDDVIEDYGTLCAGVVLGGGVTVGKAPTSGWAPQYARTRS